MTIDEVEPSGPGMRRLAGKWAFQTVSQARRYLMVYYPWLTAIPRSLDDSPAIVEVWM